MAWDKDTRSAARAAYVVDKLDLVDAAKTCGVPYDTLRKWKMSAQMQGDDWDKARAAHSMSASGSGAIAQLVLHDFLIMYQGTIEEVRAAGDVSAVDKAGILSKLADAFQKTMSSVAKAAPDLGRYAVATELLQDMTNFVAEKFPQHLPAMLEVLEPFGGYVAKKYE